MDRDRATASQKARLAEEREANTKVGPLFKDGKANHPNAVKSPADLPKRWYGVLEHHIILRMSPLVPYDEVRRYALALTLLDWRKNLCAKAGRREAREAGAGKVGLFAGKESK